MNLISFGFFVMTTCETQTIVIAQMYALTYLPPLITIYSCLYRGTQGWPFDLVVKCEPVPDKREQFRLYQPRSGLLLSKSTLPRLLMEVDSKPEKERPEDLVRMLLTGATVVRFANKFLDRFKDAKNFVLFAIFIWSDSKVSCFSLFQLPNDPVVCWTLYIIKLAG
jgi:hypothetical protein